MTEDDGLGGPSKPTADSLAGSLFERVHASVTTLSAAFQLALAEARLAATSAGLLLLIGILLLAMVLIIWLLCVALLGVLLHTAGLSVAVVLLILLGLHLAISAGLLWFGRRLSGHLSFSHTRDALAYRQELADVTRQQH